MCVVCYIEINICLLNVIIVLTLLYSGCVAAFYVDLCMTLLICFAD